MSRLCNQGSDISMAGHGEVTQPNQEWPSQQRKGPSRCLLLMLADGNSGCPPWTIHTDIWSPALKPLDGQLRLRQSVSARGSTDRTARTACFSILSGLSPLISGAIQTLASGSEGKSNSQPASSRVRRAAGRSSAVRTLTRSQTNVVGAVLHAGDPSSRGLRNRKKRAAPTRAPLSDHGPKTESEVISSWRAPASRRAG